GKVMGRLKMTRYLPASPVSARAGPRRQGPCRYSRVWLVSSSDTRAASSPSASRTASSRFSARTLNGAMASPSKYTIWLGFSFMLLLQWSKGPDRTVNGRPGPLYVSHPGLRLLDLHHVNVLPAVVSSVAVHVEPGEHVHDDAFRFACRLGLDLDGRGDASVEEDPQGILARPHHRAGALGQFPLSDQVIALDLQPAQRDGLGQGD